VQNLCPTRFRPLRHAKLRKGGKGVTSWKPFVATLWVTNSTRQGLASQRKRVLRRGGATPSTKRRQLGLKPCYGASRYLPAVSLRLCAIGGQAGAALGRAASGAAGVEEHGIGPSGLPGNTGDPATPSRQTVASDPPMPKVLAPSRRRAGAERPRQAPGMVPPSEGQRSAGGRFAGSRSAS
jgi:hypothetical protein